MKFEDICYLCESVGSLAGIPVRIFNGKDQVFLHSIINLIRDPASLYADDILAINNSIGYFITPHFFYYGIVKSGRYSIIIGPSRQISSSDQELKELAFNLDISADETDDFLSAMKSIVQMPLESIMQILCTINFVLNGEKRSISDILIYDTEQKELERGLQQKNAEKHFSVGPEPAPDHEVHNTYDIEQTIMDMIRRGDTTALNGWIAHAPAVRSGVLAGEQLRQLKNTFIVTCTLASRAAIRGGMDIDDAFALSNSYIQKCELLNSPDRITNLQFHMVTEYTKRVENLRKGSQPTKLMLDITNYIRHHISETVTVEKIASELYISRSYLSRKFKEDTGYTLTDYILREKTAEAKRLIRYSDKSMNAIGLYLGFSSQSHFTRVFKKYTGLTPNEYRMKFM